MIFCGIDPGLDGAICILLDIPKLEDTPTLIVTGGKKKKRVYNVGLMVQIIEGIRRIGRKGLKVGLESVHAMPGQGVTSMFSMGHGLGLWEGILSALKVPYQMVTPQAWKKKLMNGMPKEKDASRQVAMRLFPSTIPKLSLKKNHGRADALLLAEYLRRQHHGAF